MVAVPYASIAGIIVEHRALFVEITENCVYRIEAMTFGRGQRIGHYEKNMSVGAEANKYLLKILSDFLSRKGP